MRGPREMARPGIATGRVEGLCTSSHGFGSRAVERSVYVTVSTSPTVAWCRSSQEPASKDG